MSGRTSVIPFKLGIGSKALTARRLQRDEEARKAAFEAQLEPCWEPLWRCAYHWSNTAEDASDLLSETVLEGYKSFPRFRGETTFLKWMYRIMSTTRIDLYRKNRRHQAPSLDAMYEEHGEPAEVVDENSDPAILLLDGEFSSPVHSALSALSDEYRIIVVLADIEGLDYTEIAQVLHIPLGTVRSRLHRARARLRQMLLRDEELGDYYSDLSRSRYTQDPGARCKK
jgi:RNA polymerase sigma-70 factor, ECF subfamily